MGTRGEENSVMDKSPKAEHKNETVIVNMIEKNKTLKIEVLSLSLYVPNIKVKNKNGKREYLL